MPLEDQYYRGLQRGLAVRPEQSAVPQLGSIAGGYGQAQLGNYANAMNRDVQIMGLRNQLSDERMFQREARGENRMATAIGVGNLGLVGSQMVEARKERERQEREHKDMLAKYDFILQTFKDNLNKQIEEYKKSSLGAPVSPQLSTIGGM